MVRKKSTTSILIAGNSAAHPDIEYATGFRASGATVLLVERGTPCLVVPGMEAGRAQRVLAGKRKGSVGNSGTREVFTPETLGLDAGQQRRLSEWVIALLRKRRVRRVSVPSAFPLGVARKLEEAGIKLMIADGPLFPEREIKTGREIRCIRESQQAAVIAMRAAVALIGSSDVGTAGFLKVRGKHLTSEEVRRTIAGVLLDHGCTGRDTIVAGGVQATDPHEVGSGPLRAHEPIVLDIFPQHTGHGYWGDLTRTVVKGTVPPLVRKMFAAVKAAQSTALSRVKSGVKCATVHKAASEEFRKRGFRTRLNGAEREGFIHSTGHGVGLSVHEAPSVGLSETRLKSGHVITVEPGLYYPEVGGVRIEDTVVVSSSGWTYLTPCEKRVEV